MSEIRRDEIVYEEGWRDAAIPEQEEMSAQPEQEPTESLQDKEKESESRPLLTILQLVLCMAAALVLFLLKAMDSEAYHGFMHTYAEAMAKPVISQELFEKVDWNALFGGDHLTVTATPDEAARR